MQHLVRTLLLLSIAVLPVAGVMAQEPSPVADIQWARYHDADSGTSLDYPASVFTSPAGAPALGTGQRFTSHDGRAMLSIYSLPNTDRETPSSFLHKNIRAEVQQVQYQRVTPRFLALSTESEGRIYYTRCNFARTGVIHCFDLTYPADEKSEWDPS